MGGRTGQIILIWPAQVARSYTEMRTWVFDLQLNVEILCRNQAFHLCRYTEQTGRFELRWIRLS